MLACIDTPIRHQLIDSRCGRPLDGMTIAKANKALWVLIQCGDCQDEVLASPVSARKRTVCPGNAGRINRLDKIDLVKNVVVTRSFFAPSLLLAGHMVRLATFLSTRPVHLTGLQLPWPNLSSTRTL